MQSATLAFTDGACSANGKPNACAGWAFEILCGPCEGLAESGTVPATEFTTDLEDSLVNTAYATPTNNRAEYYAVARCLSALVKSRVSGPVEIVSDSQLVINTLLIWLPKRKLKGTANELKNFDLVLVCERLMNKLNVNATLKLSHVAAHQRKPPPTADARLRVLWAGNDRVDKAASRWTH